MTHAAEIAGTFFPDVDDEEDSCVMTRVGSLIRAGYRQHHGEPATVVADTRAGHAPALLFHPDVGSLGKNRVEMSGDHDGRTTASPLSLGQHIPDRIDAGG